MALPSILYHYTKEINTICSILENGFWPKYSPENIEWMEFASDKELGLPMVCFCDIPIQHIASHTRIFGYYGIGMNRSWADTNDISPVHYIKHNSFVAELYQSLKVNAKDELKRLTAYTQNYDFISETEWRYVPNKSGIPGYVVDRTLCDQGSMDYFNGITRQHAMLQFSEHDVSYIIVKYNHEIQAITNWIAQTHSSNKAAILISKVVACESYMTLP